MKQKVTMLGLMMLFITSISGIQTIQAQVSESGFELLLNSGNYTHPSNLAEFEQWFGANKSNQPVIYRIIQFYEVPNQQARQELASKGVRLYGYLPNKAYYTGILPSAPMEALGQYHVRGVYEIKQEYKLHLSLLLQEYPEHALREGGRIELFIHHFPGIEADIIQQLISAENINFTEQGISENMLVVNAGIEKLSWLASQPYIYFIEPVNPTPLPDNNTGRTQHRSNTINSDHPLGRHFDGAGVKVMLQDDGIIGPHIDYQGRIGQQNISYNNGDHGDHCAGIIFGAGNLDPRLRGMATGATLYVYGASGYQGFNSIASHYYTPGIRVTSTSYSDGCNAGYTSLARAMDQQIRTFPKLMHVFSSGNDGISNCGYGAGAGWGNITGGHKAGKNVIAVGNLNYIDNLSSSSSRGPAHDGRIKPEVTAKGTNVNSTTNPNLYVLKSGTSMACPGVAGTVAQLYQAYRELNNQLDPDGGLIKAILMNSADDIGNPGPDFRHGFGRINAFRAVRTIEDARFDSATVEQGQLITRQIIIPANLKQLRIMVYWTDMEGTVGATKALVNNLNMTVIDPESTLYLPLILDHTPNATTLNAPATPGVDSINNVEQVTINNPVAGTYQVSITGHLVPQGPQKCFITWEFITQEIFLTYPIGGESFVPGESETIRWDAFGSDGTFSLDYTTDGGNTWMGISSTIGADQRYYDWTVPMAVSGQVMLLLTRDGQETINPYPFSIMGVPTNLNISWACNNEFRLAWDEVFGAEGYVVRMLGDQYMDSISYTASTSYIFTGTGLVEKWVSVQAIGANDAVGRRAEALRKTTGSVNCQNVDLAAEAIPSTAWTVYQTANDLSQFPVNIRFRNNTMNPVSNFTVGYKVNNGEATNVPLAITLMPDSVQLFQFPTTADLTEPGTYTIKAWVAHPLDAVRSNDTITKAIRVIESDLVIPENYIQNFDAFTRCLAYPTCEAYLCDLAEGYINLINNDEDQIDWRTFGGGTPTGNTGPTGDHTTGSNVGNYLYLEPSVVCTNREAIMVTPVFDLTNRSEAIIKFWYHMYGASMGRLHVDALVGYEIMYDVIEPILGNRGNEWLEMFIENIPADIVTFRFRGVTGPGQTSDIAIDDFEIIMPVGISDVQKSQAEMKIFPNPGTGVFNLTLKGFSDTDVNIIVMDMFGKELKNMHLEMKGPMLYQNLDLSQLPSGIYLVTAQSNSSRAYLKLIKQ